MTPANPSYQQAYRDPLGAYGLKGDFWFSDPTLSSPPSPSTLVILFDCCLLAPRLTFNSIGSASDSQAGGDYFPPSDGVGAGEYYTQPDAVSGGEATERYFQARPILQPNPNRRQQLSLNISALPSPFQNVQFASPSSLASSGAPYTDSFSLSNGVNYGQDYFHFDEASLPSSATEPNAPSDCFAEAHQQYGYRLPASQPSSPVRTIYPSGQVTYPFQSGRQRGATFSGGTYSYMGEQFGPALVSLRQQAAPSAIPAHLTFTNNQSPVHSASGSPLLPPSGPHVQTDSGYFGEIQPSGVGLGLGEESMEDVSTPTPALPSMPVAPSFSRRASGHLTSSSMTPDMSADMVEKLTLLDQ